MVSHGDLHTSSWKNRIDKQHESSNISCDELLARYTGLDVGISNGPTSHDIRLRLRACPETDAEDEEAEGEEENEEKEREEANKEEKREEEYEEEAKKDDGNEEKNEQ